MSCRAQRAALSLAALLLALPASVVADEPACKAGDPGVDPPRPLETVEPSYPEEARAAGVTGRVILNVLVDASGRVAAVETIRTPYGGEMLGPAAVATVERWRYEPARKGGEKIACWAIASLEFYPPRPSPPPSSTGRSGRREPAAPPPGQDAGEPRPAGRAEEPPTRGRATEPAGPPVPAPGGREDRVSATPPSPEEPPSAAADAEGAADDRWIRPEAGGPDPLVLGAPVDGAAAFLAGAIALEGGTRLRVPEAGVEVTIGDGGRIESIRYVFEERPGEFEASAWRTRSGLGAGSSCLGIAPAHGRPDERAEGTRDGAPIVRLVYRRGGATFQFLCAGNRLVELVLEEAG